MGMISIFLSGMMGWFEPISKVFAEWNSAVESHVPLFKEILYWVIGLQLLHAGVSALLDKTNMNRLGSGLFWILSGVTFIGGSFIPPLYIGILICLIGLLTLFKQVKTGDLPEVDQEKAEENAQKFGNKIFIPVLMLGFVAMIVGLTFESLSAVSVGLGAFVGTLCVLWITRSKPVDLLASNSRMVQQVSTTGILPQLLAALGAIFTAAGVGEVISSIIGGLVPADSRFFGVVAYVLGMVIFTMIMGNAFAAFTVITAGVGVPFVFALGADPYIAGALAMTAGFCGTLMTPMAGNFNALPAALLEMKDEYKVIKEQIPVALIMVVVHVVLMYVLAF